MTTGTEPTLAGEGFAFACWYRTNFPFFSTYKATYFNQCVLDDWRHGYR